MQGKLTYQGVIRFPELTLLASASVVLARARRSVGVEGKTFACIKRNAGCQRHRTGRLLERPGIAAWDSVTQVTILSFAGGNSGGP